jgi:uncharacterized RDD family membrane protein YckC
LIADGQTVGKKMLGIQIVTIDNKIPSLWKSFVIREFLPVLLYYTLREVVTAYFIRQNLSLLLLCDTLFVFRPDRRCLHDFLAGTKVIDKVQFLAGARFQARKEATVSQIWEEQIPVPDSQSVYIEKEPLSTLLQYKMASRADRFLSYLIDKITHLIAFGLIGYAIEHSRLNFLLQMSVGGFSSLFTCINFTLAFLFLNAFFLVKNQQTLGKLFFGMKIVGMDQSKVSFFKIFFFREFLFWGLWPFIAKNSEPDLLSACYQLSLLINALFIYREDRRCLHDWASQTRVVYVHKDCAKNIKRGEYL